MPQYSIIIPAYNESARLGATLDRVLDHVAAQHWDAEVIVVNDGSRDDTAEMVLARARANPALRLVENPGNHGKGYSVRNGMLKAAGEKPGSIFFDASDPFSGQASDKPAPGLVELPLTSVDHEIASRGLPGPYLLKFDVHGFELPILRGAQSAFG